jgi:hypothetical protein
MSSTVARLTLHAVVTSTVKERVSCNERVTSACPARVAPPVVGCSPGPDPDDPAVYVY